MMPILAIMFIEHHAYQLSAFITSEPFWIVTFSKYIFH